MSSDAVPELIIIDERSRRETVELCGDPRDGLRCTRNKDHTGLHECLGLRGPVQWASSLAASR